MIREIAEPTGDDLDTDSSVPSAAPIPMRGSGRLIDLLRRTWPVCLLILLVVVSFGLRLLWLDQPHDTLIFDESYYVNAARIILDLPVAADAPYASAPRGRDPNSEHPPLGKLLIAGSIALFGDNAWGWRLPSILFGTLAIPLLYGVARRLGAAASLALLATFLFAFDNLVFVHGRIGTLDIFVVALLLLGLYAYLCDHPLLAGLALAGATLCKIGGAYGIGALVLLEGLRLLRARSTTGRWQFESLIPLVNGGIVYVTALFALLALLDRRWGAYQNPFQHFGHILDYGFALTRPDGPQGQESAPWQWLLNEVQMSYLRTDTQEIVGGEVQVTRALIYFRGAMNPFLIGSLPFAIAAVAQSAWRRRDDFSFATLALFVATYLPFWFADLVAHRISYIFYFLPTIPALALATAAFLHSPALPRPARWAFIAAFLLGVYGYFPFRVIP